MKTLSAAAQDKIAAFLTSPQVRPLEAVLYRYHFAGGSSTDVLTALTPFQNADGGFGHGMEPDVRLADSSAIATSVAFQRLHEIGAGGNHPLVANGCRYLRETYIPATANWEIIPSNVDDAPHAPWWVYGEELSHSPVNPRAEILGYLYDYPGHFPAEMRQQATDSIVGYLLDDANELEMHDLYCAIRLSETESLPADIKTPLIERLKRAAEKSVTRDPAGWRGYGLQPLGVVSKPESPFAPLFPDEIELNLDFMIDQLDEAGYWRPNWNWGHSPDAWAQAEREWRGVLTLNNLLTLRNFGRLE